MLIVALLLVALAALALRTSEDKRKRSGISAWGCRNAFLWGTAIAAGLLLLSVASVATGTPGDPAV